MWINGPDNGITYYLARRVKYNQVQSGESIKFVDRTTSVGLMKVLKISFQWRPSCQLETNPEFTS